MDFDPVLAFIIIIGHNRNLSYANWVSLLIWLGSQIDQESMDWSVFGRTDFMKCLVWQPMMTLIAQLKMKKTILIEKSWSWPFSKCSTKPNENFCEHKMTEMEIIRNCSCSYGLGIHNMVSVNQYSAYHIVHIIWYSVNHMTLSYGQDFSVMDPFWRLLYPAIDRTNVRECNFTVTACHR